MLSLIDKGEKTVSENCRRLVVLGSTMVGKSAIIKRFLSGTFENRYMPTVEDFHRKIYKIRRQTYRLDILDCSGHNPFPTVRKLSYMTGDMFLVVYDVCRRNTFEEAKLILEQLNECFTSADKADDHRPTPVVCPPLILVGNQIDKEANRVISSTECLTLLAGRPCCAFIEVSAMLNMNIRELFGRLFELAHLPMEMNPDRHRKVTPSYVGSTQERGIKGFMSRKISEACGVIQPNVRRPSVGTDMKMALERENRNKHHRKRSNDSILKKQNKCCFIQ